MKPFFILLLLLINATPAEAAPVIRQPGESDAALVARATASTIIDQQIAHTQSLRPGTDILVAFTQDTTNYKDENGIYDAALNLFVPTVTEGTYNWVHVEACEVEGGSPTVRSFFYANADADPDLEIAVICGWDALHAFDYDAGDCGMHDEVRFFKIPSDTSKSAITELKNNAYSAFYSHVKLSPKAPNTCKKEKFSNARDVKKILSTLAFGSRADPR